MHGAQKISSGLVMVLFMFFSNMRGELNMDYLIMREDIYDRLKKSENERVAAIKYYEELYPTRSLEDDSLLYHEQCLFLTYSIDKQKLFLASARMLPEGRKQEEKKLQV